MVPISAKEGTNIDDLLDHLLLVADVEKEHIVANPDDRAIGTVIESNVNPNSGPVATVLVQSGTLRIGDILGVRASLFGRVRAMQNWKGDEIKAAPPSTPVRIIGWKLAPTVGDIMEVPLNVKDLRKIKSTDISTKATEEVAAIKQVVNVEEGEEGEEVKKEMLNLVIRTDVLGSLEAILGMLDKIKHEDIGVKVVQKGLGNITETDVLTAEATKAIVLGFNVQSIGAAEELARDKEVDVRRFKVIYKLFEEVIDELQKRLPSETVITEMGKFEVIKNFKKDDKGWIVGGKVKEEKIIPKAKVRLLRNGEYVGEGEILTLQLGNAQLKDGKPGQEVGMMYKGKVKPEEGDVFETYVEQRKSRELKLEGIDLR